MFYAILSLEMLSDFLLINKNCIALGCNTPMDVFGVSLDAVIDIVNTMDSNTDTFAHDFDSEIFYY